MILNVLVMGVFLLCTNIAYEWPDDFEMSVWIARDGAPYMGYLNIVLSWLIMLVQKIVPFCNAFVLLELFFAFLSFTAITYVFLDKFRSYKGLIVSLFIEAVFVWNHYSVIQFTKTSAILLLAGFLLVLHGLIKKKKLRFQVTGIAFILFGTFYRFLNFYVAAAFAAVYVAADFIVNKRYAGFAGAGKKWREFFRYARPYLICCLVILALSFSFQAASKMIKTSTEELRYFADYNSYRAYVVDYPIPDYEAHQKEYRELGMSENDYKMLGGWYLDDQGATDLQTLKGIKKIQTDEINYISFFKNVVGNELYEIRTFSNSGFLILVFLALLALYAVFCKKRSYFFPAGLIAACGVLYTYLNYIGRMPYRAVYGIWVFAIVLLLYSLSCNCFRERMYRAVTSKKKVFAFVLSLLLAVFSVVGFHIFMRNNQALFTSEPKQEFESYAASQPEKIFVLSINANKQIRNNSAQYTHPLSYLDPDKDLNTVTFGMTAYASPYYKEQLRKLGFSNLYKDMVDNENVYFVDTYEVSMVCRYITEHYFEGSGEEVTAVPVKEADGLTVYQLKTVPSFKE